MTSRIAFLAGVLFISFGALASADLEVCLANAHKQNRVIDQKQSIESCFQLHSKKTLQKQCFEKIQREPLVHKNSDLQENLNSICFYQSSEVPNVKSCLQAAEKFKIADNHDEAIFECYRLFQSKVSQTQCFEISRKLIYPNKKNYLLRHCQNNY